MTTIALAPSRTTRRSRVNVTLLRLELTRILRDPVTFFFVAGLPSLLYVIFGASAEYADAELAHGNVALYVMIGMAAYGAVTASTNIGGAAAIERMQGWGRQLGLTPLRDRDLILTKALVAVIIGAVPVTVIYLIGLLTGAEGEVGVWLLSGAIVVVGSLTFALFGLAIGMAFRSEAAVSAASGSLVILSFLGNLFFPLSGTWLAIAKFTPLYGYAALARRPVTGGETFNGDGETLGSDAVWQLALNVGSWTLLFAVLAIWLVRRGRTRQ